MIDIHLQKPHAGQVPVIEAIRTHRRTVIRCGRRWGKSSLLEHVAARAALHGQRVGWFGPQYRLNAPTYRRLLRTLRPLVESASKIDQAIALRTGGGVEFWTLQDPDAGRSRFYDLAILDEASLIPLGLRETFEQSIMPTLLDREGRAVMAGTPKGRDPENYFFIACEDKALGWHECHAPTSENPTLPRDAVARLKDENAPLVYQQEYLAEFVDWSGQAFFARDDLLVDGQPATLGRCDVVFAVIDTAIKVGEGHDATAVVYYAADTITGPPLAILDWDLVRIDSHLLTNWLPGVLAHLDELAKTHHARMGSAGAYIEDKASGTTLLQSARANGRKAQAIRAPLTAMGKDERAVAASPAVHQGRVKLTRPALDKTMNFDGRTLNHLLDQVTTYRYGIKTLHRMDLLDCFTYGVLIALATH